MSDTVTIEQKKDFIKWFLNRYQMKRRECVWILSYLRSNAEVLENVHFVTSNAGVSRSMIMSTTDTQQPPFKFCKDGVNSADAEKAFHDIRLNPSKKLYIELNFPNNTAIEYLSILEDNPHAIEITKSKDVEFVEDFIAHIMKLSETEKRNRLIDEALDTGNKAWFMELTSTGSLEGSL